jgi:hypothetical protein
VLIRISAVAIAVSLLAAAGCGGTSRRTVVAHYIDGVNAIEAKLARPLLTISEADRDFAHPHPDVSSVLLRLRRSKARIHVLAGRLAALPPPPEARRLRRLLVELLDREQSLVGEVEKMAVFIPAFNRTLAPLGTANTELKRDLARKTSPDVKARALDRFRARVVSVEEALRKLHPPPSSEPAWSQQMAALERAKAAVEALSFALRHKEASVIPRLVHAFDVAAASNKTISAQRAEIAAVAAYDERIKSLDGLGTTIAREETRLERTVH